MHPQQRTISCLRLVDDPAYWKNVGIDTRGPWLGGFQPDGSIEPDQNWQWVTSEPFVYTAWSPGEPNNYLASEDSLDFTAQGNDNRAPNWNDLVNDTGADNPIGYVVEYVPSQARSCGPAGAMAGMFLLRSRIVPNRAAPVALHVAHYNFCRRHTTLRMTQAMAANVTGTLWSLEDLYDRVMW